MNPFPVPYHPPNSHYLDFYLCKLVLPAFETYTSEILHYTVFCVWFLSLNSIFVRFICVVAYDYRQSFLSTVWFSIVQILQLMDIWVSIFGISHSAYFLLVNICAHFCWLYVQEWNCWLIGVYMFTLIDAMEYFSKIIIPNYNLTLTLWVLQWLHILANREYYQSFSFLSFWWRYTSITLRF